ncbi:hypothetical protein Taro_048479, partial [Colocasia esculenta]|nr:hypothetical protein [Colocasia esculenta]
PCPLCFLSVPKSSPRSGSTDPPDAGEEAAMEAPEECVELKELHRLEGHTDRVWSLAWNPVTGGDGAPAVLASCSGDKTVRIWRQNLATGSWDCTTILEETHTRTVRSCAWSPSGSLLATASFDATTALWENVGDEFECISTLEGHENEVKSVSWSASGSLLATCSRDKSVWIWEVQSGGNECDCVSVLQGHTQDVKMVQWHPNMDVLVSVSYDNSIKVWAEDGDIDDWRCIQTLEESSNGHASTVWAVSFNSDGDRMVTCSNDLTLKIWDTNSNPIQRSDGSHGPWEKGFSVYRGGGAAISSPTFPLLNPIGEMHRRHLCTLSGYHDRTIFSVDWSRDGIIASGAGDDAICLFVENKDGQIDGPSYKMIMKKEKSHEMDVNAVRWNPKDPRLLASASDDGTIKIWQCTY